MPLYVEDGNWFELALHCIIPSLGDGLIVMLICGVGWAVRGRSDWTDQPGWAAYALMLMTGFSVAVIVEWVGFLWPQSLELHSQHAAAAGSGHWCRSRPADANTPAPYFQDYWLVACADAMGLDSHVEANGKRVSKVQTNDAGLAA